MTIFPAIKDVEMTNNIQVEMEDHRKTGTPPHCDCCGRTNMQVTFKFTKNQDFLFNIGVICATKWFGGSYTGNKSAAAKRIKNKLSSLNEEAVNSIFGRIEYQKNDREISEEL